MKVNVQGIDKEIITRDLAIIIAKSLVKMTESRDSVYLKALKGKLFQAFEDLVIEGQYGPWSPEISNALRVFEEEGVLAPFKKKGARFTYTMHSVGDKESLFKVASATLKVVKDVEKLVDFLTAEEMSAVQKSTNLDELF